MYLISIQLNWFPLKHNNKKHLIFIKKVTDIYFVIFKENKVNLQLDILALNETFVIIY